jgi:4-amino-4-deoxychorismate lyase
LSVKTTSRAESLIGRREARSMGFDEGIFLNERGHVTEGCTTNVFWIKGEVMFTPHPRCGLLPGIVRGAVISLAPRIGLHLEECEAPLQELLSADEIFLTNSVIGAARVIEVDGQKTGRNRQLYLRVRGELFRLLGWED